MKSHRLWVLVLVIGGIAIAGAAARAQREAEPDVRLREALHKEQVEGDLAGAIKLYERIAADHQTPRPVAAQALFSLGRCHEKLGNREAQKVYERIVDQFADQGATLSQAKARLAALRVATPGRASGITSSKLATAGYFYSPNASADGRVVVASKDSVLGVLDLTTAVVKPLPYDPDRQRGYNSQVVISPDSKRVAYPARVNGASDFRVMNVDGSDLRVFKPEADYEGFLPLDWSRDDRYIAGLMVKLQPTVDVRRALPSFAMFDIVGRKFRVFDAALAGLESPGAFLRGIRLSPDGAYVAFAVTRSPNGGSGRFRRDGEIYTMRVDATGRERLPTGDEPAELVGWLPDGKGIAFVSERNGVRSMFGIHVEQGKARGSVVTLFRGVGRNQALGFTAGGSLTYAVDGRLLHAYVADLRQQPPLRTVISSHAEWTISPSWSPAGDQVAFFVHPPFMGDDAQSRLMIRELATGTDRLLLQWHGEERRGSAWTADGASLIVARQVESATFGAGIFQVDRIDVATGAAHVLTKAEVPISYPRMTPDARHLYYQEGVGAGTTKTVVRLNLAAKERSVISRTIEGFDLSRDGSQLALVDRAASGPVIKVQPTDGGPARIVISLRPGDRITSIAFSPDGASLVYAKGESETLASEFFRMPLQGPPSPVALGVSATSFPDIAVHPDNQRLAFIDNEFQVDFWQMHGLAEAFAAATRAAAAPPSSGGPRPK
ncbi:MAG TPA: hypothetical protein VKE96_10810 [Vicinamibacterales bacterium]|nr:hypothetical protein [Vicinamibacterales bacterium]